MFDYTVAGMYSNPEGFFSVKVNLGKKEKYKIILKFSNELIEKIINNVSSKDETEDNLNFLLMENDKFLFIRLVRIALGNEAIKIQLRAKQNGMFIIDSPRWQQIMNKIEREELELILAEGFPE